MTMNTSIEKIEIEEVKNPVGRPRGKIMRLTIDRLLDSIEITTGTNFAMLVAEGYQDAILSGDRKLRLEYERMLLNKLVADKLDVTVGESEDTIEAKKLAFQEAVKHLTSIAAHPTDSAEVNKLQ